MKYVAKNRTEIEAVQVLKWDFDLLKSIRNLSASDTEVKWVLPFAGDGLVLEINGVLFGAKLGDYIWFHGGSYHWMNEKDFKENWEGKESLTEI